eukprot:m.404833 g.404833  ORF g.404833 m.404833 type:complete len:51 (+) comp21201_c0_seq1:2397-2549(+)
MVIKKMMKMMKWATTKVQSSTRDKHLREIYLCGTRRDMCVPHAGRIIYIF